MARGNQSIASCPHGRASSLFRHVYLGAMAKKTGRAGDKHISYPAPGVTGCPGRLASTKPWRRCLDRPRAPKADRVSNDQVSILDTAPSPIWPICAAGWAPPKGRSWSFTDALREVERRVQGLGAMMPGSGDCKNPRIDVLGSGSSAWYDPMYFPRSWVGPDRPHGLQAMACGTEGRGVATTTSELIASRFPSDGDSRSRLRHAPATRPALRTTPRSRAPQFRDYLAATLVRCQFAHLLDQKSPTWRTAAPCSTHSLVLLCTEVCDGNTHSHDNMFFILAGCAGGRLK